MLAKISWKLFIGFLWLLFLFLLMQGAGYAYFNLFDIKAVGEYGYPNGLIVPHKELDYLYKPEFNGHFIGGDYHDINISINRDGFRDSPFAKDDSKKLVVLGDSVVFGAGLAKSDRLTEQLDSHSWIKEHQYNVVNMGVNSYTFAHYLTLAKLDFFGIKPSFVLVGFTLNDIAPKQEAWPAWRYGTLRDQAKSNKPKWLSTVQKTLDRTYAGRFVRELKTRLKTLMMDAKEKKAYHSHWMTTVNKTWEKQANLTRLQKELQEFDDTMRRKNIPYGFILFPELNTILHPNEFDHAYKTALSTLTRINDKVCDPNPIFANRKNNVRDLFLPMDSVHFTAAGNGLLSETAASCMAGLIKNSAD